MRFYINALHLTIVSNWKWFFHDSFHSFYVKDKNDVNLIFLAQILNLILVVLWWMAASLLNLKCVWLGLDWLIAYRQFEWGPWLRWKLLSRKERKKNTYRNYALPKLKWVIHWKWYWKENIFVCNNGKVCKSLQKAPFNKKRAKFCDIALNYEKNQSDWCVYVTFIHSLSLTHFLSFLSNNCLSTISISSNAMILIQLKLTYCTRVCG